MQPRTQCPQCGSRFAVKPGPGRKRVYCSDACQQKQFRNTLSVTKFTHAQRRDLINKHLFVGDWRLGHHFAGWARYTCLACAAPIDGSVEAWYDFKSWDQCRGVLTRLLCANCYALKGGEN